MKLQELYFGPYLVIWISCTIFVCVLVLAGPETDAGWCIRGSYDYDTKRDMENKQAVCHGSGSGYTYTLFITAYCTLYIVHCTCDAILGVI